MEKSALIELIRKLFALGDKTRNNSEAEAETATKKAMELLQKHNLDMAEVLINDQKEKVVEIKIEHEIVFELKRSSMSTWEKSLIRIVSEATETTGYFGNRRNDNGGITWYVAYIGTEWDRAIAKELYLYLHSTIYRMSKKFYPDSMPSQRNFMEGFVYRLSQRISEQNREFNKQSATNEKYAMVLVDKKAAIEVYGKTRIGLVTKKGRHGGGEWDSTAFEHGKNEANKVDIGTKQRLGESGGTNDHKYE